MRVELLLHHELAVGFCCVVGAGIERDDICEAGGGGCEWPGIGDGGADGAAYDSCGCHVENEYSVTKLGA